MKKNLMMRVASALLVAVLLTTCAISGTFAKYVTSASSEDKARVAYWGFQSSNALDITGLFDVAYAMDDQNVADIDDSVASVNTSNVIAPGTTGTVSFTFVWDGTVNENTGTDPAGIRGHAETAAVAGIKGPEVAYKFSISVDNHCDALIQNNKNILWQLDGGKLGTWTELIASITKLSGDVSGTKAYAPNDLPDAFETAVTGGYSGTHTITWVWLFDENSEAEGSDASTTQIVTGNTADYQDVVIATDPTSGAEVTTDLTQDEYDTFMANADLLDSVYIKITITATQID